MLMQDEQQSNYFADSAPSGNDNPVEVGPKSDESLVSWSASEFIAHHKSPSWYVLLAGAVGLLTALVYVLTRDAVSAVVIAITGVLFGVFASRKPEVRTYEIYPSGIQISDRFFPFDSIKSFAIHQEGTLTSVFLLPMKRLMPPLTIYFPPEQENEITKVLADYLPLEDKDPDAIDNLMRKIRF